MKKPLLSILSITYNHEKFIAQAIDSFLMQKTNFDFEIVIGEDCSTDNTLKIIEKYKQKYPNKIRLITSEKNVGMQANFIRTLEACQGKYIALCEGDDYWTDPYKLQKQVDFLENNLTYSIVFHDVMILKEGVLVKDFITRDVAETTSINDLLIGNYIHTPSVVFRNVLKKYVLPDNFSNSPLGDFYLHLYNAQFGKIKKLKSCAAVYRFGGGIWSSNMCEKDRAKKIITTYKLAFEGLCENNNIARAYFKKLINYTERGLISKQDDIFEKEFDKSLIDIYNPHVMKEKVKFKILLITIGLKIKKIIFKW